MARGYRNRKRAFNERLTLFEKRLQNLPAWLIALIAVVLIVPVSLKVDQEINLSWPPLPSDIASKIYIVLIDKIEAIAIFTAVVQYLKDAPDRKDRKHYEAWQVIDNAKGVETSYARYKALQDLNDDDVSMQGLDAPRADLEGIQLVEADLRGASLPRANLAKADLRGANLAGADLSEANLSEAILCGANLSEAILCGANLSNADFRGETLYLSTFKGTNFCPVPPAPTPIGEKLFYSFLLNTEFRGRNITGADLTKTDLRGANLYGTKFEGAIFCDTKLPEEFELPAKHHTETP